MEYLVISVIVVAALACPVLMCGPMILRRVGLMKSTGSDMSCMGMMPGRGHPRSEERALLGSKRDAIDREIARLQASASDDSSQANSPLERRKAAGGGGG